jgi:2-methylisocitrate lyase-like PEP mutase family enzyme
MRAEVERFRRLHQSGAPLILPNAWDVASAAALARAGFAAIGTTSLGVAVANGLPDAAGVTRVETVELVRRSAGVPALLTVDVEGGFDDAAGVAAEIADAGAVGINIEDGRPDGSLTPLAEQVARIAAVKARVPDLFVNARTDTHWLAVDKERTLERVRAYADAGADGVFVPGLADPDDVVRVVRSVPIPVNVLYLPGRHTVAQLAGLGVRRVSTGSLLFRAALAATVRTAEAVRDGGAVPESLPSYAEAQALVGS